MFVCKDQQAVELIMMAGNPNWWSRSMDANIRSSTTADHHHHHHQEVAPNFLMISQNNPLLPVQYLHGSSSSSASSPSSPLPFTSLGHDHHHQHHHHPHDYCHHSWSQLLLGGLGSSSDHQQEESFGPSLFQSTRVMNNNSVVDVKQEVNSQNANNNNNNNFLYGYSHPQEEQETTAGISSSSCRPPTAAPNWSHSNFPASSPKSCVTSLSSNNNILDFSTSKRSAQAESHQHVEHSNSECNSTAATGAVPNKKPRVQSSSNPPLKVRKEKLGDRITALHQLVSPFGKTDTASVLLEAIGYIKFLQGQIEALSSPYLGGNNASGKHPHAIHNERSCLFPNHPGQEKREGAKDLKSRGLCLVPISCTQLVGSDNGADYWAPSLGGGF